MSYECHHPFAIYLAGAEAPIWRSAVVDEGAPHIAINFLNLLPRLPKTKPYVLAERYPEDVEILIDSGGYGAEKRQINHDEHASTYIEFVAKNIDRISLVTEYDPDGVSLDWIERWREDFWDQLPREKFVPIWHESHGLEELDHLCDNYVRVGILKPDQGLVEAKLRTLAARTGTKFHGVAITGPDDLRRLPLTTASSMSWISPTRFGDTQVWAGGRFHWYPARTRLQSRTRHRSDVARAGFDAQLYIDGDRREVARYTVWAWRQYEASLAEKRDRRGHLRPVDGGEIVDIQDAVDHREKRAEAEDTVTHRPSTELVRRDEKTTFPSLLLGSEKVANPQQGEGDHVQVVSLKESGLRQCDSCYLQARCPAFSPGSECAFSMPVEIRTKEQLLRSLTSCLEMQMARVAFARAAEEADGGIINADVSAEIERYFKMVQSLKEIQSDTTFLRIEAKGQAAPGMLSGLLASAFGQSTGVALGAQARAQNDLDPAAADEVVRDFIDVGPVEDD